MRAKSVNFERGRDPKKALGIGRLYNIDFFYSDHPSIEDSEVADFVENLESVIYDIDPGVKYEIRIDDGFSDGHINFAGSKLSGDQMFKKLKKARDEAFGLFGTNFASWDFGDVTPGEDNSGEIFDPSDYETEYCDNCGEEITPGNELTGDGHCEACAPDEDEDNED